MSSSQRSPRQRSARLAFEEDDAPPPSKKARLEEDADGKPSDGPTKEQVTIAGRKGNASTVSGSAVAGKKAKIAYAEDADGFQYSRAPKTKKAPPKRRSSVKTAAAAPQEAQSETTAEAKARPAQSAKKKRTSPQQPQGPASNGSSPPKRRSARLSGEKKASETAPQADDSTPKPTAAGDEERGRARTPQNDQLHVEKKRAPTKIALPFADTPVLARNKEMRKSSGDNRRRSSSQMRGRRASSLIDSGTSNAVPHSEVDAAEFYKHISQDLPEPRRMKQLLIWCGTRVLPEKPTGSTEEVNAGLAARVIQEELLGDFSSKSEMSDWFSREDDIIPAAVIKKPNPRNIQNAIRLQELENEVQRLKREKSNWDLVLGSLSSSLEQETQEAKSKLHAPGNAADASSLDASLLSGSDQAALSELALQPDTFGAAASRLQAATTPFEFKIDSFADGVHKLEQYKESADEIVDHVLAASAKVLGDREQAAMESAGTDKIGVRDLLKSLSRAA